MKPSSVEEGLDLHKLLLCYTGNTSPLERASRRAALPVIFELWESDTVERLSAVSVEQIYPFEKPEYKPVSASKFRKNAGWQLSEADFSELIILLDKARLLHCLIR